MKPTDLFNARAREEMLESQPVYEEIIMNGGGL